jgi:molybdopterin converting factor small subunit
VVGAATGTVRIELVPWLTDRFGGVGSSRLILEARIDGRVSLRELLVSLADSYPAVGTTIVDVARDALFDHVNVVHNGTLLGSSDALDEPVAPGDALVFLPAFSGG